MPLYLQDSSVPDGGSDEIASLQSQVKTLREALDTIMEQKTKMEGSFQADKKKYLVSNVRCSSALEMSGSTSSSDFNLYHSFQAFSLKYFVRSINLQTSSLNVLH